MGLPLRTAGLTHCSTYPSTCPSKRFSALHGTLCVPAACSHEPLVASRPLQCLTSIVNVGFPLCMVVRSLFSLWGQFQSWPGFLTSAPLAAPWTPWISGWTFHPCEMEVPDPGHQENTWYRTHPSAASDLGGALRGLTPFWASLLFFSLFGWRKDWVGLNILGKE